MCKFIKIMPKTLKIKTFKKQYIYTFEVAVFSTQSKTYT